MLRKDIRTGREPVACDICGRTLLSGEEAETYLAGGSRRQVCELCSGRALHQGWVREAAQVEVGLTAPRNEERRPLLERFRGRRERSAPEAVPLGDGAGTATSHPDGDLDPGPVEVVAATPAPAVRAPAPEPDSWDPPSEPRHIHAVPASGEMKAAQALERFNSSRHRRTISGVAKSLGIPAVSVRTTPGQLSVVSLVVSWELCWYRYEVDLASDGDAVRQVDQGYELSELDEADQAPNAVADASGGLALGA